MEEPPNSSTATNNDITSDIAASDVNTSDSVESTLSCMRSIGLVLSTDNENRMITALVLLSMVHQKWLIDSGISFHAMPERSIFGFGCGSRVKVVGAVVLNLEIHGLFLKLTMFYVVQTDAEFNVPVILVVDMLKENNLVVDIQRMILSQRHDDESSVDYYVGSNSSHCRLIYRNIACSVTERAVVPAGETVALPVAPRYPLRKLNCCQFCPSSEEEMFYFEENLDLNILQAYPGIFTPGESIFTVLYPRSFLQTEWSLPRRSVSRCYRLELMKLSAMMT